VSAEVQQLLLYIKLLSVSFHIDTEF